MRSIRIFLLFVASVLATDNKNYNGQPVDYFDDDFQSNLKVGPDSTFSFNFEQIRHDQPPQVEMREENVGRYFHTRPQTTTTASIFSMKAEKESQHVYPTMTLANNYHHQQDHLNEPHVASVPLKFAFSRPQINQQNLEKSSILTWNNPTVQRNAHPGNSLNNFTPQVPSAPTPASHTAQWTELPKSQSTPSPYVAPSHSIDIEGIQFAPSASYVSDSITNNVPRQPPSLANRGKHKFSWDDIKKEKPIVNPQYPETSSTPQSIHNKSPPPVPTLSPWYDNFGK
ncbi:uncharacterized protein LOC123866594 [Maniola jurtina]|uniref:uncharacterized protein LOC123866594 n=1 Tax=Maniola jurtina TaxID=191418 RepID=UPI001E689F10|nr:uncharacterized protein LOC123866594 [Maniola jurtina]